MNAITITSTIKATPSIMASAFWAMSSIEQAEFFNELALIIQNDNKTNANAYSLGELQWHYVGDELDKPKNKLAREMLMTMAAPLYLHTLCFMGSGAA